MSNQRPPPPPPPPAWFVQQQQQQQQQHPFYYSQQQSVSAAKYYNYTSSYGNYAPLPPPPHQQSLDDNTVPPPLYGYNPSSCHYSQTQTQQHTTKRPDANKRRRVDSRINIDSTTPATTTTTTNSSSLNDYKCNVCQLSFDSHSSLKAHVDSHVKCNKCSFEASRKVVNAHYASVHGKYAGQRGFKQVTIVIPGKRRVVQRFNICVGNHPDDVQKWIAQRRKNYPRQQRTRQRNDAATAENETTTTVAVQIKKEEKKSSSLGSLLDGYGSSSSSSSSEEEEDDETSATAPTSLVDRHKCVAKDKETSLLKSVVDVDIVEETQKQQQLHTPTATTRTDETTSATTLPTNYRTRPCRYFMRNGSCRNGNACHFRHDDVVQQQHRSRGGDERSKQRTSSSRQRRQQSATTTLLGKLFENDRQREAALSVQLLEYLVDSNYLQETTTTTTTKLLKR